MRVICDIEADGLEPTKIHLIVCKDIDNETVHVFRDLGTEPADRAFQQFARSVDLWVGHNFLGYDAPALRRLCGIDIPVSAVVDTLVVSRLLDADREGGHSIETWGEYFGRQKEGKDISDWSVLTPEMEARCLSDVEINFLLYRHFNKYLVSPRWKASIETEHYIAAFCRTLSDNGFAFDFEGALRLSEVISGELKELDKVLKENFLPKVIFVTSITPRLTKHGTLNRSDFRWVADGDLSPYSAGAEFSRIAYQEFNPGSPKQIVERLNQAGWAPTEKTKGHRDTEKALRELKRKRRKGGSDFDEIKRLQARLAEYAIMGWSISEENLKTLPDTAPPAAKQLAWRLMIANRLSTLESWMKVARKEEDGQYRIHGSFNHIGAWTGRMSHDKPNMGNIPKFDAKQPHKTPYSGAMRRLWRSAPSRFLVGVDAESIQLRIFGHYINDPEFIKALCEGTKEDGTDPHSVNWRALGDPCKSRDDAKTFIYAWLLGAGVLKVSQILGCSLEEAEEAGENFLDRYPGLKYLKEEVIPLDAARGYFTGFDGRLVKIWGEDVDSRRHFALAGYLQSGESIIMKRAVQIWEPKLRQEGVPFWPVNFVHDEFQTETIQDREVALYVAQTQAEAIRQVGMDLELKCPMAGSYLGAGLVDWRTTTNPVKLAIGHNWMETH